MTLIHGIFAAGHNLLPFLSPKIAQTAGTTLLTAIWQGAILALCVAGTLKIARRTTAALRFSIWVAGFVAAVCMPFWPIFWNKLATHASLSVASAEVSSPWIQVDLRWSLALGLLWASASIYRAADLAIHAMRLRALWKDAKPVPVAKLNFLPLSTSGRRIEICTTLKQDRPGVIGFFAPRILIPEWLLDRLTPAELTQIVLHETEHIRRGDDWTNLLQKLGLVLFPLNPALLWMDRRLCVEREMACDEAVVRATRAPRAYAACLTNLAEHGRAWHRQAMERAALTLGAWQRRSELVGRVHSILRSRNASEPTFGTLHSRGIFALLTCGLMLGSVELARCPQLVAFVPAHTEQIAAAQVRPEQNAHRVIQPSMGTMQTVSTRGMSQPRMTNLKAIVPARDASSYATYDDIPASKSGAGWKPKLANIRETVPALGKRSLKHANESSSRAVLTAEGAGTAETEDSSPANSASNATGQEGWLVLTTWEEVATTDSPAMVNTSARTSAADSQDTATTEMTADPSANSSTRQADQQAMQQIRVTRVVFRVVPASFISPSPHVARTRTTISDGWLVIQL